MEKSCTIVDEQEIEESPIHFKKILHSRESDESTEMECDVGEENTLITSIPLTNFVRPDFDSCENLPEFECALNASSAEKNGGGCYEKCVMF